MSAKPAPAPIATASARGPGGHGDTDAQPGRQDWPVAQEEHPAQYGQRDSRDGADRHHHTHRPPGQAPVEAEHGGPAARPRQRSPPGVRRADRRCGHQDRGRQRQQQPADLPEEGDHREVRPAGQQPAGGVDDAVTDRRGQREQSTHRAPVPGTSTSTPAGPARAQAGTARIVSGGRVRDGTPAGMGLLLRAGGLRARKSPPERDARRGGRCRGPCRGRRRRRPVSAPFGGGCWGTSRPAWRNRTMPEERAP